MATSAIQTKEVTGLYNMWGINVYDYTLTSGSTTSSVMDFQDLLTDVSIKRAYGIEKEITPLATQMENRNTQLEQLGAWLSGLADASADFGSEPSASTKGKFTLTDSAAHGAMDMGIYYGGWGKISTDSSGVKWVEVDLNSTAYKYKVGTSQEITYNDYCYFNQLTKSQIDNLNNDSQNDMTRLQSLVSRRDESYSTATTLMTSVSDSRSKLLQNI